LHSTDAGKRIPLTEVLKVSEDVVSEIDEALSRKELEVYEQAFNNVKKVITEFTLRHKTFVDESVETEAKGRIETLLNKKAEIEKEIVVRKENEQSLLEHSLEIKKSLEEKKDQSRDAERELFSFMNNLNELERSISDLRNKENTLIILEEEFKREVGEAAVLIGRAVLEYKSFDLSSVSESTREKQHDLRKNIERKKLRIEEAGASGGDEIMKEYKEVSERDSFLERELIDLKATSENLTQIINELDIKLTTEFKSGIDTINKEFSKYFEIMFGGGHAKLVVVKEVKKRKAAADADDEVGDVADTVSDSEATLDVADAAFDAEGVDIEVSLPRKKIKGLVMLSGGERALTSIALIFAVSQVNPPPFIILDETDAALDEANSRKYGDMIENLAAYSQLILITHNRETMSRASTIYGVTMGLGGASKLLSIEFDEAVSVAK
jgi:chromosome segregation protein